MRYETYPPILGVVLMLGLLLSACSTPKQNAQSSKPITFALIGDVPYSEHDEKVGFPNMGFKEFLALIEKETIAFKKPVVFVHGDSHYFRIDKPLLGSKSKRRIENFTRVETFGFPDVHWVHVTVDENDPNVFVFRQRIVEKNLLDHSRPVPP